jgi:hypothetical protein
MTVDLFKIVGNTNIGNLYIQYKKYNLVAVWTDHDGSLYIHRWEHGRESVFDIFDVELCKYSIFHVCKIIGVDEI